MERISVQAFLLQPTRVECGGGLLTGAAQYTYDSGVMMYIYGIVGSGGKLLSGIVSGGRARHRFSRDPVQEDCGLISDLHQRLILSKGVITYVDPSGCEKHPYRHSG